MRVMLRRERRRRNIMEFQGHSLPLPHNALVERSDLLNHTARYYEYHILVTRDRYLATGVRHSPFPLCLCRIFDDIDEALDVVRLTHPLGLIIDLEGHSLAVITLLDRLRLLRQSYPALDIVLLTPEVDPGAQLFLQAACHCRVLDKRLALFQAREALHFQNQNQPLLPRLFKGKEWSVLMMMSEGYTLCHIARLQVRPYHRIIYRVGCVLTLLRLNHRHQLLRLLQRIGAIRDAYNSG